jgi:acyl-coenzyme A thioesterase 9
MEVVVKMQGARAGAAPTGSSSEEDWETLMLGRFAMVCRNAKTLKARKVPPLLVESEEEKMLWDLGEGELY